MNRYHLERVTNIKSEEYLWFLTASVYCVSFISLLSVVAWIVSKLEKVQTQKPMIAGKYLQMLYFKFPNTSKANYKLTGMNYYSCGYLQWKITPGNVLR